MTVIDHYNHTIDLADVKSFVEFISLRGFSVKATIRATTVVGWTLHKAHTAYDRDQRWDHSRPRTHHRPYKREDTRNRCRSNTFYSPVGTVRRLQV